MKKGSLTCLAAFAALACAAVDPSLMLVQTHTDPTRMSAEMDVDEPFCAMLAFARGGERAFTWMVWIRRRRFGNWAFGAEHFFASSFTVDPARATLEGGDGLPELVPYVTRQMSGGVAGGVFADPGYSCPPVLEDQWGAGCYAVNVETDSPLTLVLAGTERQIAASNGVRQAFNVQGSVADWSWSLSGDPGANVKFGFAVNPLVEFMGTTLQTSYVTGTIYDSMAGTPMDAPGITNEWTLAVCRARFDGTNVLHEVSQLGWDWERFAEQPAMKVTGRTAFARNARLSINLYSLYRKVGERCRLDMYGRKCFEGWLEDDEVRHVRDLDAREMVRRGQARYCEQQQ